MMHQATVIQVDGNFDQALSIVKTLSRRSSHRACKFSESISYRGTKDRSHGGAINWAMRRRSMSFRLEMPAISLPTGKATRNIVQPIRAGGSRG